MLVVADASPLVGLVKIGHADVLPALYGQVVIPPRVAEELNSPKRPSELRAFMASAPPWIAVRAPSRLEVIEDLDAGELADLLLIDEARGREAAIALHTPTARTAAVLFDAANAGVLPDLRAAFDKLRATNFRVPGKVLDELLARHLATKK